MRLRPRRLPGSALQRLALVRMLLGLHLLVWTVVDIPHLVTLYGTPVFSVGRLVGWLLSVLPRDTLLIGSTIAVVIGAVALVVGFWRRSGALLCFVGDSLLLELDPGIRSPDLPYIRLLLLVLVLLPAAEPRWWWSSSSTSCEFGWRGHLRGASLVMWGALAFGMSCAGISKLTGGDAAWTSGSAFAVMLDQSAWVRPTARALLSLLPDALLVATGAGALLLEVGGVAVVLRSIRWPWWLASSCMHLGALLVFSIPQVSVALLIVHLFLAVDDDLVLGTASHSSN